ncbi:MAG: ATP citrate lyase citrate-binding domain-containing protein [Patescibacteria group bacterium]
MSRVKITEYRAKKLILGDAYTGISIQNERDTLPKSGRFVAKVDQGIKKRFKQGLVAVDVPLREVSKSLIAWKKKGFSRFLVEAYIPHKESEEQYLSLERVRTGIRILHASAGGIDIEAHPELVKTYLINPAHPYMGVPGIPEKFLEHLVGVFEKNFFSFLEINPLIVRGSAVYVLDAAGLVDSTGVFFVRGAWSEGDIVESKTKHDAEERVQALQKTTPASLKLTVLHPKGSLFFLLSGGGGSIVIADEAELKGLGSAIGNYGEYSGGPTREETHLYAREVIQLLLESPAKKKALVIAGGIANFTDVMATFAGIIDALSENSAKLRAKGVKVFVRRGGPNEAVGLAHIEEYLKKEKLFGSVYGSSAVITRAVDDAIDFVQS